MTARKFKIGQSVRLRSTVHAHQGEAGEYRIVRQLPQTDGSIRYRVRSSAANSMRWSSKKASFSAGRIPRSARIVRGVEVVGRQRFVGVRLSSI